MKAALAKLWPKWVAGVRKAVTAGVGALGAGAVGIATSDGFDVSKVTQAQVSSVLLLGLTAAVATFAIPNKVKPLVEQAERTVADAGGKAIVAVLPDVAAAVHSVLTPALGTLLQDLVAAGQIPLPAEVDPATYGVHAAGPAPDGTRIG